MLAEVFAMKDHHQVRVFNITSPRYSLIRLLLQLTVLSVVCHIIADIWFGQYHYLWIYTIPLGGVGVASCLQSRDTLAKSVVLSYGLITMTLYILVKNDVFQLAIFLPITVAALTIFPYEEHNKRLAFSTLAIALFVGLLWMIFNGYLLQPHPPLPSQAYIFFNNVTCSILAIVASFALIKAHVSINSSVITDSQERREIYELLLKASRSGIVEYDFDNNVAPYSRELNELLGYPRNFFPSKFTIGDTFSLIHPDDLPTVKSKLTKLVSGSSSSITFEHRLRKHSGDYQWFKGVATVFNDRKSKSRLVSCIVDIDDSKRYQQRILSQYRNAVKMNDELDLFAYHVSHDVRSPISSILGLASLAKRECTDEASKKYIAMINERAANLDKFVSQVLALYRNKSSIEKELINFEELVKHILSEIRLEYSLDQIDIKVISDPNISLSTDRPRLHVILKNIITNSVIFQRTNSAKHTIMISLHRNQKGIQISIEDNGQGIKNEHMPNVFKMFFRGSEKSKGSGLGLYIARQFLNRLGGSIIIKSTYDHGTIATIKLP